MASTLVNDAGNKKKSSALEFDLKAPRVETLTILPMQCLFRSSALCFILFVTNLVQLQIVSKYILVMVVMVLVSSLLRNGSKSDQGLFRLHRL